jgi:hypothetical protein
LSEIAWILYGIARVSSGINSLSDETDSELNNSRPNPINLSLVSYDIRLMSYDIARMSDEIKTTSDEIATMSDKIKTISDDIKTVPPHLNKKRGHGAVASRRSFAESSPTVDTQLPEEYYDRNALFPQTTGVLNRKAIQTNRTTIQTELSENHREGPPR